MENKTIVNVVVDTENAIGVALVANEPDEPFGTTSVCLRVYKDNTDNILAERRFIAEDRLACFRIYLIPSEDLVLNFLGIRIELKMNEEKRVILDIDTPDYYSEFELRGTEGTTEVPF